jgi:cyclic beta-1,2-glucan synthetase
VLGLDVAAVGEAFALLPALCFPAAPEGAAVQSDLWPFGISGDLPIAAACYESDTQLDRARRSMDLHLFLSGCGCAFDLVFLSRDGASYRKPLRTALSDALWRAGGELLRDAGGGVHIIEDTPEAAVISDCAALTLPLSGPFVPPPRSPGQQCVLPSRMRRFPAQLPVRYEWLRDGAFQFYVNRSLPQRVWQNVLSNGRFGYLATDCGTGHLWLGDAREYQLTPWRGLPSETAGPERLELETGGERFSLFAAPGDTDCSVRYAPGAAVWEKKCRGAHVRTTAFVPPDTDCRVLLIELEGSAADAVIHWCAGLLLAARPADARFVRTASGLGGLLAENPRGGGAPFLAFASPAPEAFTCDRAAAWAGKYDGAVGTAAESVFALRLRPGREAVIVCGCDAPETLRALTEPAAARAALRRTLEHWAGLTGKLRIASPSAELNRYVNLWAPYQTVACRLMGRSSIYQCGGAYGFRDQLQDAVNLIALDPAPAREQLLRCAARQYAEGDVQHWWHVSGGVCRGLRSRCSDDLLWLPWALSEYVEKTGDDSVCSEQLPYLISPPLRPDEHDRCEAPPSGDKPENLLLHCRRALTLVLDRGRGGHGLLRMGSGDWNDGFDAVGGESVWLTWFFLHVADRFNALCAERAPSLAVPEKYLAALAAAADDSWDGDHYLRGWYADGRPLGARGAAECAIDSVAQSWAAFCDRADPEKADAALTAAVRQLFDRERRLVKLFDPPFTGEGAKPGYLASYGPGFRENGGQYTHAALWLVQALLRRDRREEAWELLSALLPAGRESVEYLCEPYVLAADVYSAPGHAGEGGWSWYTGAAGWLLRIVTEDLLGFRLQNGALTLRPRLPAALIPTVVRYQGHDYRLPDDG